MIPLGRKRAGESREEAIEERGNAYFVDCRSIHKSGIRKKKILI